MEESRGKGGAGGEEVRQGGTVWERKMKEISEGKEEEEVVRKIKYRTDFFFVWQS